MFYNEFQFFAQSTAAATRYGLHGLDEVLKFFTINWIALAASVIVLKIYYLNPLSCYIPVGLNGDNFLKYVNNYCWLRGTIPLRDGEILPDTEAIWEKYERYRRISYYQWIPFILNIEACVYLLLMSLFKRFSTIIIGVDMQALIRTAVTESRAEGAQRRKSAINVALCIQQWIRHKNGRRTNARNRISHFFSSETVFGSRLFTAYILLKMILLIHTFCEVLLIQYFLGFYSGGSSGPTSMNLGVNVGEGKSLQVSSQTTTNLSGMHFGLVLFYYLCRGYEWPTTTLFPRTAYCRIPNFRLIGVRQSYVAKCTLMVNMLAEKIFVFLYFWHWFIIIIYCVSIPRLLIRMCAESKRKSLVKRYLEMNGKSYEKEKAAEFINTYLSFDDHFLIRILSENVGDTFTIDVVDQLYIFHDDPDKKYNG